MKVPFKKPLGDVDPPEYVHIPELNGGQLIAEKQAKDYLPAIAGGMGRSLAQPLRDVKSKMLRVPKPCFRSPPLGLPGLRRTKPASRVTGLSHPRRAWPCWGLKSCWERRKRFQDRGLQTTVGWRLRGLKGSRSPICKKRLLNGPICTGFQGPQCLQRVPGRKGEVRWCTRS